MQEDIGLLGVRGPGHRFSAKDLTLESGDRSPHSKELVLTLYHGQGGLVLGVPGLGFARSAGHFGFGLKSVVTPTAKPVAIANRASGPLALAFPWMALAYPWVALAFPWAGGHFFEFFLLGLQGFAFVFASGFAFGLGAVLAPAARPVDNVAIKASDAIPGNFKRREVINDLL